MSEFESHTALQQSGSSSSLLRDPHGRAGASVISDQSGATGYPDFIQPFDADQYDADNLPMLIWLRGDEPICSEFTLDADAVMAELGIKRSRLTQIAGKEIRVGRLRVGRYVRPVFRAEDVQAYKSWVRASASHLKSSRAIEDAAAKLEHETSNLAHKVVDAASSRLEILDERMLTLHQTSQRLFVDFAAGMNSNIQALQDRAGKLEHTLRSRDNTLTDSMNAVSHQVQSQNDVIHSALAALAGLIQSQKIELQDFGKSGVFIAKKLEDLDQTLQKLRSDRARVSSGTSRKRTKRQMAVARSRRESGKFSAASSVRSPMQVARQLRRATRR